MKCLPMPGFGEPPRLRSPFSGDAFGPAFALPCRKQRRRPAASGSFYKLAIAGADRCNVMS